MSIKFYGAKRMMYVAERTRFPGRHIYTPALSSSEDVSFRLERIERRKKRTKKKELSRSPRSVKRYLATGEEGRGRGRS